MVQYSLELALFDLVPVVFSAFGFYFMAMTITQMRASLRKVAFFSVALIVTGGLLKVSWKIFIAAASVDYYWMNNALFIFMAPGFTLLCYTFWLAKNQVNGNTISFSIRPALVPIILLGGFALYAALAFPEKRYWFFVLLMWLTIASTIFSVMVITYGFKQRLPLGAILLSLNLFANFALAGLARTGDQSEAMQWIMEITNACSQFCFAFGAWLLYQHRRAREDNLVLATESA